MSDTVENSEATEVVEETEATEVAEVETPAETPTVEVVHEEEPKEEAEAAEGEPQVEEEDFSGKYEAVKSELDALTSRLAEAEAKATEGESFRTELESLKTSAAARELALTKQVVGIRHGLPADLIDRLTGDDEAALTEDAKKLAGFVRNSSADLGTGGLDPSKDAFDAKALAAQYRKTMHGGR